MVKQTENECLLEILELELGTLSIRPAEGTENPLISVTFSNELIDALGDRYPDIARIMLTAGVQLALEADADEVFTDNKSELDELKTLH